MGHLIGPNIVWWYDFCHIKILKFTPSPIIRILSDCFCIATLNQSVPHFMVVRGNCPKKGQFFDHYQNNFLSFFNQKTTACTLFKSWRIWKRGLTTSFSPSNCPLLQQVAIKTPPTILHVLTKNETRKGSIAKKWHLKAIGWGWCDSKMAKLFWVGLNCNEKFVTTIFCWKLPHLLCVKRNKKKLTHSKKYLHMWPRSCPFHNSISQVCHCNTYLFTGLHGVSYWFGYIYLSIRFL